MSSQDSFDLDSISTLLLAMNRVWHSRPEKSLGNVLHLVGSTSYGFLDALATLCAFAPRCDAAAVVMGCKRNDGQLYIAVNPIASPELQLFVPQLLDLVQLLPCNPSTLLDVSKGFDVEALRSAGVASADHQVIVTVYRTCREKFCASVRGEGGCRSLLEVLPKRCEAEFYPDEWEMLSAKLDYLLDVTSRDVEELSDSDYVALHYTAVYVLESAMRKRADLPCAVSAGIKDLESFLLAVRTILATARKEHGVARQWDVQWIASSTARDFRASMDEDHVRKSLGVVTDEIFVYPPPKTLARDPTSQCVTGVAHIHPEATLLGYLRRYKVDVSGYMGASSPTCYPCLMLLYSLNVEVRAELDAEERERAVLGEVDVNRCSFRIDLPWCPPPTMDRALLGTFKAMLVEDYALIVHLETVQARLDNSLLRRAIPGAFSSQLGAVTSPWSLVPGLDVAL